MAFYRKKPVVIEAITFDEFVQYGKENGGNIVNGMPWSFKYKGHPVTHHSDEAYLIPSLEGTVKFTREDMLITGVDGEIYPCKISIFKKTYTKAKEPMPAEVKEAYKYMEDCHKDLGFMGSPEYYEKKKIVDNYNQSKKK
jgi:hypothetical protein